MSMTVSSSRTVSSIVAGRPDADAPGGRETSTNPADTGEVVADVLLGDASTFVAACEAARAAQREWAAVPAPVRGRAIQQIGRLVEDNKEALARLVTREIGKPYAESLGEVQEIVDTCNFFLGEGRRLYGQTVPSEMPD
jgi:acyl-CoA reductase-like NAD-dependent aldehyde dehydrogenase